MNEADIVSWEAVYDDGWVLREREGHRYAEIDRNRLKAFRLVRAGELVFELDVTRDGRTGHNFVYRRRTIMGVGAGRDVIFLLGFAPMGPVIAVNPDLGKYAVREFFDPHDEVFAPPDPIPQEGEMFSVDHLLHRTDARLQASQIRLPSGYVMNVR